MHGVAEQLTVLLQGQHVGVGIDALLVKHIQIDQMVAHLVGRIAEHQDDLLGALGDAAQADGETVAAEDREDDADGLTAQLGTHVVGNVIHAAVVALRAGDDSLGHRDDVAVTGSKLTAIGRSHDAIGHDLHQIIAFTDDRRTNAHGNSTNHSAHISTLLILLDLQLN